MSILERESGAPVAPAPSEIVRSRLARPVLRPEVRGKFIFIGDDKFFVRGVTYGAFRPDRDDREYHDSAIIESDFAQMAARGINAVRIPHTMPPRSLLDVARQHGLRVMVGLSAEQCLGLLVDKKQSLAEIGSLVRAKVRECAGHSALLCYALGIEIAAPMARWLGRARIERYLGRLAQAVKTEDPGGLVTYVNYPTTEYLELPFLDLICFNVYLESQARFEAYLGRLQNIAGERPLVMSELGLDGLRNGEEAQAHAVDWQVRTAFAGGCAGAFVFSWTDEWYRQGHDVEDWGFGLTRADRSPKPALDAVRNAFAEVPFAPTRPWPRISVVVCSYNGARTIRDCLEALERITYPDFEVIVVDDGSTDATAAIAARYDCRLIQTENRGLASARNTGLEAATGEIVAYTDDDAYPDPDWLTYLASTFLTTTHAGVGGPNLAPPGDGAIADCVARAPGGPNHVLLSDREAEHIPGCNMAFRAASLRAIGGFDPQFRIAGDDVDVCWRLQASGASLGFAHAAVVWHHRRNSVRAYWRQQLHYGRAEAMLERKWPEKYNGAGHVSWSGRLYGQGLPQVLSRGRIYHGAWGSAPFQSLYQPTPGTLWSLAGTPEWVLVITALAGLSLLGLVWRPLLLALVPLAIAALLPLLHAGLGAARATFPLSPSPRERFGLRLRTAFLYLIQPLARLRGRLQLGLTPWRERRTAGLAPPLPRTMSPWSERWQDLDQRLRAVEATLKAGGAATRRGGDYERWDLEVRGGLLGAARLLAAAEDHGGGAQLVRFRWWPQWSYMAIALALLFAALTGGATFAQDWTAAAFFGAVTALLVLRAVLECAGASASISRAVRPGSVA